MGSVEDFIKVEIGAGYGDGYGTGSGYGSGYGYGTGYGTGYGIKYFNGQKVECIDEINTIIQKIRGNIAKGYILQSDLTLTPCYVVKNGNLFAHGKTLKEARDALLDKMFEEMSGDDRINEFLKVFTDKDKKYPAIDFYEWHHKLTGSCKAGRDAFVKDLGIDINTAEYTVDEFIKITSGSYGGDIIEKLAERWMKFDNT